MLATTSMESKKRRSRMFLLDDCFLWDFLSFSIPPMGEKKRENNW